MSKSAVQKACEAEFEKFAAEIEVPSNPFTPMERMMFNAGFVRGAQWKQDEVEGVFRQSADDAKGAA